MELQQALLSGASIGLTVAAPVGPMAVIVIRRTISSGFLVGVVTGAGASTIHLAYATLAICGVDQIASRIRGQQTTLTVVTTLILLFFSIRMLRPRSISRSAGLKPKSLLGHYAAAMAFSSVNPMGFTLILGAVTALSGLVSLDLSGTAALAAGVFAGSILWWISLVAITAGIGIRISPRTIRLIDIAAGLLLLALALSTASRLV